MSYYRSGRAPVRKLPAGKATKKKMSNEPTEKKKFKVGDIVDICRGKQAGSYGEVVEIFKKQVYNYSSGYSYQWYWYYKVKIAGYQDTKSYRASSLKPGGPPVSDDELAEVGIDLEKIFKDLVDIPNVSGKVEVA